MTEQKQDNLSGVVNLDNGNKYQNGKIYEIYNGEDEKDNYIGSTTLELQKKFGGYKTSAMCSSSGSYNKGIWKHMRGKGVDKFKIRLIEKYPCNSKIELFTREQYWQDLKKPSINKQRAIRTEGQKYTQKREAGSKYDRSDRGQKMRKINSKISRITMICDCGSRTSKNAQSKYRRTKTHYDWLKENKKIPNELAYETYKNSNITIINGYH